MDIPVASQLYCVNIHCRPAELIAIDKRQPEQQYIAVADLAGVLLAAHIARGSNNSKICLYFLRQFIGNAQK